MVYTLAQGAQGYNKGLHYSLYGGVERFSEHSLSLKELAPLMVIPAVAIAMLVAILNFHIPVLSPATGGYGAGATSGAGNHTLTLSAVQNSGAAKNGSSTNKSSAKPSKNNGSATLASPVSYAAAGPISSGSDNGQGIIGGTGGDGALTTPSTPSTPTSPAPTPSAPSTGISASVTTPVVSGDTTTTTQPTQTTVNVTSPLGVSATAGVSL